MLRALMRRGASVAAALAVLISSVAIAASAIAGSNANELYPLLPMSVSTVGGLKAEKKLSNRLFTASEVASVSADTPFVASESAVSTAGGRLVFGGFDQPTEKATHLLLYVKVPTANTVTLTVKMRDDYASSSVPNLVLKAKASYQVMPLGGKWSDAKTVNSGAGALKFDKAFEGYVKIPLSTFKDDASGANVAAVLTEIDYMTGLEARFAGVGGKYGTIEMLPYLVVADNGSTSFKIADDYVAPTSSAVQVTPITDVTMNTWCPSVSSTMVNPLDFTKAFGNKVTGINGKESYLGDNNLASGITYNGGEPLVNSSNGKTWTGQLYTGFHASNVSLEGSQGLVFYVKVDAANLVMPEMNFDMPDEKSRWRYTWNPQLFLGVGYTYQYMSIDGGDWKTGVAVAGDPTKTTYGSIDGCVQFDGAFEGYIKVPYASLVGDSGFILSADLDSFLRVNFKLLGAGGKYGEPVIGPLFLVNEEGSTGLELKTVKANATVVHPLYVTNDKNGANTAAEIVKPISGSSAQGIKMTSKDGQEHENASYLSSYNDLFTRLFFGECDTNGNVTNGTPYSLKDTEGFIVYIKTDAANEIGVEFCVNNKGQDYQPQMTLVPGAQYEYLELGGTEWKTGVAGVGNKKTENGNVVDKTDMFGTVKFDGAFEGYVKFPYSALTNDWKPKSVDPENHTLARVEFKVKGLGGKYGSVTVAPVYLYDTFTGGTEFINPETLLTPLDVNNTNNGSYISASKLQPVSDTNAYGLQLTSKDGAEHTVEYPGNVANTWTRVNNFASVSDKTNAYSLEDTSGLVFYLKLDSANKVLLQFAIIHSTWGYAPDMTLKPGDTYQYLPVGSAEWQTGTAVAGATKNGNERTDMFGAMSFDGAFEGYVKIPYSSLVNDANFKINVKSDKLATVDFKLGGIGGKYGSVVVGPVSLYGEDTGATRFVYSDNQQVSDPINVTPIDGSYAASGMTASETALKPVALKAANLSSDKGSKNATVTFTAKNATAAEGAGLLAYVSVPEKSSLAIKLGDKAVAGGKKLALLKKDGNTWSTVTTESDGTVYFKSAFTGFVRIPFDTVSGFNAASDKISAVELKLTGDNKLEAATLGGISLYDLNSESAELNFPAEYFATVKDKVDFILNNSKNGIAEANYFMVGDSTRHQHGYPLFRLLRDVLKNDYNVNCRIQALSGLKTAYWSGVDPELQNTGVTVDGLIAIIPDTGKNCIVDIALGINDSDKSLEEMVSYYTAGVEKLRAAKPDVTIIFTSPNMLDSSNDKRLSEYVAKLSTLDTHYTIDAHNNVMSEPFAGYYDDGWHPNIDGYRAMASYIKSCLFEGYTYTKIEADEVELDTSVALPKNATLNTSTLTASNKHYLDTSASGILVGGQRAPVFTVNGSTVTEKEYVYSSTTFVETTLSNDLVGNDYLTFYVSLPAANQLGVTCFIKGTKDAEGEKTKECIFKNAVGYQILPDGETEWQKCTSVDGRQDGSETYGAIKFDSEFSGFVRIPLSNFYGGPSSTTPINRVTVRFSNLGGEYGSVTLGAFLNMSEEPYIAKTVWKKSDLPEMTPFTDMIGLDGHWGWVTRSNVASPIPELNASDKASVKITCIPTADYGIDGFMKSVHWCGAIYDNMPIGDFTHLVFYVKVPKTKENYLSICMFTETHFEFKVMVNMPYQTMSVNENKWQHHTAFKTINQYGGIELPAGFEGLIKVPIDSLLPANRVDKDTVIAQIHYRFAYNGADDDTVLVGPVFGVTKDNDEGPAETILTALPEMSTIKSLYAVDKDDIFTDRVMLYWQEYPETDHYLIEAYEIIVENGEKSYKLVSTTKTFTNSGTALGLEAKTKYAFVIKAYDYDERLLAVYDYITVTTAEKDPYAIAGMSEEFTLDPVYYPGGQKADTESDGNGGVNLPLVIGLSAGAAVLVAAGVLVVLFVKKRRS